MAIWEREKERETLWKTFDRGNHVALFAPRRLGKTWLMRTLENEGEKKGFTTIFLDLEAETKTIGAVRKLCREISTQNIFPSLWQQLISRLTGLLQGDTPAANFQELLLKADWESMLDSTLKALNNADRPSLILVDEISVCLSSLLAASEQEGASFMRKLREVQQQYDNIRWMLTGSIGLDHVAEQYDLSGTLNLLDPFPLHPLTPDQAVAYVDHLCDTRDISRIPRDLHESIHTRLGWLTHHYLSRLLDRIEDLTGGKAVEQPHIDHAFDTLLSHPYNRVFSDWPDHINRNYPDSQKGCAHAILNTLCQHPDGETLDTLKIHPRFSAHTGSLMITLTTLKNDGFIKLNDIKPNNQNRRYTFVFGLLREYWKNSQCL